MQLITDNGVTRVFKQGQFIYKHQPKFMTDNEIWCLRRMLPSGYVPRAVQTGMEEIRLEYINSEIVTNKPFFMGHSSLVLHALYMAKIRHGDLTEYSILVRDNKPLLIDFSESRLWDDPRPDKRREGDRYWIKKTMEKLCERP